MLGFGDDHTILDYRDLSASPLVLSRADLEKLSDRFPVSADQSDADAHLFELRIETRRGTESWSKPLRLHFWYHADPGTFSLVGITHQD